MKILKILAVLVLLAPTLVACTREGEPVAKPCFVENPKAEDNVKSVDLAWDAAARPFIASGYAKDTATGNTINFDEIVAAEGVYPGRILYHSGCVINIMVRMSNEGKSGKAYVLIKDGDTNKCEKREEYVRSLRCDLTTNR